MKKTSILLAFLACSTILVTCGSVNSANANFEPGFDQPNYTPPSIVIHTPIENETYNATNSKTILNLNLNFTVTKNTHGPLLSVWYTLDDGERVYIDVNDDDKASNKNYILKFTSRLHVGCGVHSIKIGLELKSYYAQYTSGEWPSAFKSVMIDSESKPVTFTIAPTPIPTPIPTATPQTQNPPAAVPIEYVLLISLAAMAVVAPILLYRRHRKTVNINQ